MCIYTKKRKEAFWSLLGRSIRSPGPESPDSEVSGLCAENVLSLWWGPEFPAPVTGVSAPRPEFPASRTGMFAEPRLAEKMFSPWRGPEYPAPGNRSFRPKAGVSGH